MGFGFNFKDYNDRLTFKKSTIKDAKQTLDERDFLKAEISKKKRSQLKSNRTIGIWALPKST